MQQRAEIDSKTSPSSIDEAAYARRLHRTYAGGLILIGFIVFQDFLPLRTIATTALISVLAFAIALPLLSGALVLDAIETRYSRSPRNRSVIWAVYAIFVLGILAALVGVGAAFWYFGVLAGIAFLCSAILAIVIYGIYVSNLPE